MSTARRSLDECASRYECQVVHTGTAQKNVVETPKATVNTAVDPREVKITGRQPYLSVSTPQAYAETIRPIIRAASSRPA